MNCYRDKRRQREKTDIGDNSSGTCHMFARDVKESLMGWRGDDAPSPFCWTNLIATAIFGPTTDINTFNATALLIFRLLLLILYTISIN